MDQEVTYKPNVIKSLSDTRQSIEPQWFTWNFLKNKYLAPLSPKDTPSFCQPPPDPTNCRIEGRMGRRLPQVSSRSLLADLLKNLTRRGHNHPAGAHTGCPVAAYPRIVSYSSYEGTGRVTVLS